MTLLGKLISPSLFTDCPIHREVDQYDMEVLSLSGIILLPSLLVKYTIEHAKILHKKKLEVAKPRSPNVKLG